MSLTEETASTDEQVTEAGEGRPVLVLGVGFAGSAASAALARRFHVYAMDALGVRHGRLDRRPGLRKAGYCRDWRRRRYGARRRRGGWWGGERAGARFASRFAARRRGRAAEGFAEGRRRRQMRADRRPRCCRPQPGGLQDRAVPQQRSAGVRRRRRCRGRAARGLRHAARRLPDRCGALQPITVAAISARRCPGGAGQATVYACWSRIAPAFGAAPSNCSCSSPFALRCAHSARVWHFMGARREPVTSSRRQTVWLGSSGFLAAAA